MKYFWIIIFSIVVLVRSNLYGQIKSFTVKNGNWNAIVSTTTVVPGEAGTNYTVNITSATSQTLLDFDGAKNDPYTVTVQRQDTDWNSSLTLWARRTGPGTGGTTTGGVNYIQLATTSQYFFGGNFAQITGSRMVNIPIQYEIHGLSVLIPVKSYSTTILYTVISP